MNRATSWGDPDPSTLLETAWEMGMPPRRCRHRAWSGVFAVLGYGLWRHKRDQIVVVAALTLTSLESRIL